MVARCNYRTRFWPRRHLIQRRTNNFVGNRRGANGERGHVSWQIEQENHPTDAHDTATNEKSGCLGRIKSAERTASGGYQPLNSVIRPSLYGRGRVKRLLGPVMWRHALRLQKCPSDATQC
jgi:hypothetical protein